MGERIEQLEQEVKRLRAKKYLSVLGLPEPTIEDYILNGKVTISTTSKIDTITSNVQQTMEQVKKCIGDNYEIYHVVISEMFGCMVYNYLLCPVNDDEYDSIFDGIKEGYALCYSWNTDIPEYSEAGSIYVQFNKETQSLIRIN